MSGADDEIVVALTAQTAQFNEQMQQAGVPLQELQAKVAEEAAAFNAAVQGKIDAMTRLNAAFAGNLTSAEGMLEAERSLDQAMAAGAITAQEQVAYMEQLTAAEATAAASAQATAAAVGEANAAITLSGGVAREVGVMMGELLRGNYTRLEGSTITLANRTGFLSTALGALLSPLGLVAVAAAAVGVSIFEAGQEFEHMEGTVLATGGAAGYTAGQLVGMADSIGESSGSISNATEAVQRLAETGRFAGRDLQLVAQAATDMSVLTGESVESCIAQLVRLQEDPVKAVAKLNDQFHFLTVAEFQQMEAAQQSGDVMGAASIAYAAMADKMQGRTDQLNQHVNILLRSWRQLRQVWDESMQEMDHALGGGDDAYGLNEANELLKILKEQEKQAEQTGSGALPGIRLEIQRQQQVVDQLTAKFQGTAQQAKAIGDAFQESARQIDAMEKSFGKGNGDHQIAQNDKEQLEEMRLNRNLSLGEERAYWELILQTAKQGSDEYREAVQQLIEVHNKEGEAAKQAARKSEEAARQRNAATMNELQVEREETQAASAERIQLDAQMVDRALQLYGRDSSEYKRALAERLADTKAYVSAVQEEQKKQSEATAAAYKQEVDEAEKAIASVYAGRQKQAQEQLQLGQITTAQEISLLRQYAEQEYQTELDILDHYKSLMSERPNVVATINGQIEQLQRQHNQRVQQIDMQAMKQDQQIWQQRLRPITQAFDQSITGMIQGTQTLTQAWDRMLSSLLMSEIRTLANSLAQWTANELSKTGATMAANAARTASNAAAARTGMAENAAMSQKQIYNAAYTAAANTYASVSQIPYVGWILGPIAAAGAFAAVEGFDQISSAAGGWDRVPYDDAPALLHRNEMVLPANLAERVRGMTGGDGGGATHNHFHINANDSKSFHQQLLSDPRMLAKAGKVAMKAARKR